MARKTVTTKAMAKKPSKKAVKKAKPNREKSPLEIWREKVAAGKATLIELCEVYRHDDEQNFAYDYLTIFGYDAAEQMAGAVEDAMKDGDTPPETLAELKDFIGDNF
jgi:hypothetical protein